MSLYINAFPPPPPHTPTHPRAPMSAKHAYSLAPDGGGGGRKKKHRHRAPDAECTHTIKCVFLHSESPDAEHWLNRMTARFTKSSVIHVEFYFTQTHETCRITWAEPVRFSIDKNFERPGWEWIDVPMTEAQYDAVYRYCKDREGQTYDYCWYFCFPCFPILCANPHAHTCGRLCTSAFQKAKLLPSKRINALTVTPVQFRDYIYQHIEGVQKGENPVHAREDDQKHVYEV